MFVITSSFITFIKCSASQTADELQAPDSTGPEVADVSSLTGAAEAGNGQAGGPQQELGRGNASYHAPAQMARLADAADKGRPNYLTLERHCSEIDGELCLSALST